MSTAAFGRAQRDMQSYPHSSNIFKMLSDNFCNCSDHVAAPFLLKRHKQGFLGWWITIQQFETPDLQQHLTLKGFQVTKKV